VIEQVTVAVATEFLAELGEWSEPVQVQIVETPGVGTGYEMIFRTHRPIGYRVRGFPEPVTLYPLDVEVMYQGDE